MAYDLHLQHVQYMIWYTTSGLHIYATEPTATVKVNRICLLFFYILLKTCFAIKDINPDLVLLLSNLVKYFLISHTWQLWHMRTLEPGLSEISDLRQSPPVSSWIQRYSVRDSKTSQKTILFSNLRYMISVYILHTTRSQYYANYNPYHA